jgi:hypothetical protein
MVAGTLVMVPEPDLVTVNVLLDDDAVKVAPTVFSEFIVTVQLADPAQAPVQLEKMKPLSGLAVSVTN